MPSEEIHKTISTPPEKTPTQEKKPEENAIESKKQNIQQEKNKLEAKKRNIQEISEGNKTYQESLGLLDTLDGAGTIPTHPEQKIVKKVDFERAQKELKEQENKTAESIQGKMDAELESVTKNGNINSLDPVIQNKIRTEIVRNSLDVSLLPQAQKDQISRDNPHIKWEALTTLQKQQILDSEYMHKFSQEAVQEYQKLQEEAKKNGKNIDPETLKKFQSTFGLKNTDALMLSELRPNSTLPGFPSDSQIGVVQRVLSESTFSDLQKTLGEHLSWSHVPPRIKQEIVAGTLSYNPSDHSLALEAAITEARRIADNIEKVPPEMRSEVVKNQLGFDGINENRDLESKVLEGRKSGLSPTMRALADFFGPIGAALGIPFWKEYMGDRFSGDDDNEDNSSERWVEDARGGKANIGKGVLRSNKGYLDNGSGMKLEGGSYEKQAASASEAIRANKDRYMRVAEKTGVPWELIGAIHFRESSLDFNKCLHNGDPLGQKTVRVPAGRGPFNTWEEAAIDALNMKGGLGFSEITQSNQLEQVASYAEKYNGYGYRNKGVASAYVWAGTEAYTGGMYIRDHVFSRTKKDPRPGVMPIISRLVSDSVKAEKRKTEASNIASTAGAFSQEFQSAPYEHSGKNTLCSQTARKNLYTLLGRQEDVPRGNAIDVHEAYQSGATFDGMVGGYNSSWSPPENANVADIFLRSRSQYGHRVAAYKSSNGWMILDPYNGGKGTRPQPLQEYVKKDDITGVAFYQKN